MSTRGALVVRRVVVGNHWIRKIRILNTRIHVLERSSAPQLLHLNAENQILFAFTNLGNLS